MQDKSKLLVEKKLLLSLTEKTKDEIKVLKNQLNVVKNNIKDTVVLEQENKELFLSLTEKSKDEIKLIKSKLNFLEENSIKGDKGDKGDKGEKGDKGDKGERGETPNIEPLINNLNELSDNIQKRVSRITGSLANVGRGGGGSGSYWLYDLGDTDLQSIKSASNNQILKYDGALKKWKAADADFSNYATMSYVDTSINNLIGGAPGSLDTLKELADALSNDENSITNIFTSLSQKANTSSLSTVAFSGSYTDLTNKPQIGDDVVTITKTLTLTTNWQDTGIQNNNLATGTYIIQLFANDYASGGTNLNEYYSGVMSWYSNTTSSSQVLPTDEIQLHRAGAQNDGNLYLRTFRSPTIAGTNLKLQIYSNVNNSSSSNYVFSFRRLI